MRGGVRHRYPNVSGASALLEAIWKKFGGPAVVGRITGVSPQTIVNWRFWGKVPLKKVYQVAKALNIPEWGLNYHDLSCMVEHAPGWKEVVESYDFSKQQVKSILAFLDN